MKYHISAHVAASRELLLQHLYTFEAEGLNNSRNIMLICPRDASVKARITEKAVDTHALDCSISQHDGRHNFLESKLCVERGFTCSNQDVNIITVH
jgi:hypothetical protein